MARILITGANSFVGKYFMEFSQYESIAEISIFNYKPEEIDFSKYDTVLHLAAIVHQSDRIPSKEYLRVNRDLTLTVAKDAKKQGIKHFIFLSTFKVYGQQDLASKIRNENSECFPDDSYGRSKYEAEIGLRSIEDDNFKVAIIRPPLVYGGGVRANMQSLIRLIEMFPALPLGNIQNKRNFIYIENLVGFIDRIIEKNASGIFVARDNEVLSTSDLILLIATNLDKKVLLFRLPKLFIRIGTRLKPTIFERLFGSLEINNTLTLRTLDYSPPVTAKDGIAKMILAYKSDKKAGAL